MVKRILDAAVIVAVVIAAAIAAAGQTTGSISATGAQTPIDVTSKASVLVTVSGTYAGADIGFEASPSSSGTNFFPIAGVRRDALSSAVYRTGAMTNSSRSWLVDVQGFQRFRLYCWAINSGTVNWTVATIAIASGGGGGGSGDGKILDGTGAGEADVIGSAPGGTEQGVVVRNIPSGIQGVNVAQIGGTTPATNSGNKDGGTQRFVLATDQPQLTNALKVDGSAVVQPVSAGSLPLPTGAATSTKQSDGSQKSQIVDGGGNVVGTTGNGLDINIKSGNPTTIAVTQSTASSLKVEPAGNVASGATDSGNPLKVGGKYNSSAPTFTDGQRGDLQLDPNGNLKVNLAVKLDSANDSVGAVGAAASGASKSGNPVQTGGVYNSTQPTVTTGQVVENQATARGAQIVGTGADTFNVTVNAALPTGSNVIGALSPNQSVNVAQVNGVTPLMGNGATGTGSPRVTIASDNTANSNPWLAQPVPATSGGLSISATQSAASTNSTSVKGSAGQVYHVHAINTTATLYYLRLYNLSSAPTCSSATGFIMTIPIPASATGAGVVIDSALGFAFGTGIGFCLTGGGTSTDNTNAATGVFVNIFYK